MSNIYYINYKIKNYF